MSVLDVKKKDDILKSAEEMDKKFPLTASSTFLLLIESKDVRLSWIHILKRKTINYLWLL